MNTDEKPTSPHEPGTYEEEQVHSTASLDTEAVVSDTEERKEDTSQYLAQIEQLHKQLDESHQRYLRAQADFDNFRRRARTEKEEFFKFASLKIVEPLLPVMDNFERALQSSKETKDFEALVKGLDMVYRQLQQIMEKEEVTAIVAVGQPFNPLYHEAIMQVESADHEAGIVLEELVKGYMMKDKVIRPTMVRVSC